MSRSKSKSPRRGEDFLSDVQALVITLENGEKARFNIAREVSIPSDNTLVRCAKRSPARLAFWAYQTERALAHVRSQERKLAQVEGRTYEAFRRLFVEDGLDITEPRLRAGVDQDPTVRAARCKLNDLRRQHGLLRAVRDAVEHRAWTVRALLARRED